MARQVVIIQDDQEDQGCLNCLAGIGCLAILVLLAFVLAGSFGLLNSKPAPHAVKAPPPR